jgi:hypothetical protein
LDGAAVVCVTPDAAFFIRSSRTGGNQQPEHSAAAFLVQRRKHGYRLYRFHISRMMETKVAVKAAGTRPKLGLSRQRAVANPPRHPFASLCAQSRPRAIINLIGRYWHSRNGRIGFRQPLRRERSPLTLLRISGHL